ncbi:MAG: ammonium transporter [Dysgonomonas mossii]|uniref:ammonium transporter n=1 Tax=Dysgonomonas TaxID=156973 RepID=UPI001D8F3CBE|nr:MULTISPECIES: ammonium transporter [Dysgonomonas]MBS5796446.1 ammonium transporter [Dysgonomonas mossii]MBS5980407.1 ammonium transporter [Dysgonomonas mossii]MBS7111692.1 ammonium transporter [Dysgonomonas mossii]
MKHRLFKYVTIILFIAMVLPTAVWAQDSLTTVADSLKTTTAIPVEAVAAATEEPTVLNSGNTAWIIVATVLVMMMTIPGLALFYGGLVRQKNILSILMQCLMATGIISIIWVAFGYSWVFGTSFMDSGSPLGQIIGGFDKAFLHGIKLDTYMSGVGIPEILFALFQCMFAVITPALIIGAFAERIKFSGYVVFIILWSIIVYNPMAHWVWGGGWLMKMGAIDFAGGTVVHINAGISALVMAIMLGRRKGYRTIGHPFTPHNIPFVFIGTSLLWLGWFGFNAGSGLAADGLAANAFLVTHLATSAAAVIWMALEWILYKKPTIVGFCTGAVAGLVAITPAAGTADVLGAFAIGGISALVCFFMVAYVKPKLKYDDSLDAFGVHGIGGIVGSILTGVFATRAITGPEGVQGALYGDWNQLWIQVVATGASVVYSAVLTFILFFIVNKTIGLRVSKDDESTGLDISQHGEIAYSEEE